MRTSLSLPSQEKKKRPYFSRGAAAFLSGLSVPTATFVLSLSLSLSLPAVPPPVWRGGGLACTKSQKIRRKTEKINSPVVFECIAHLATINRHLDVGAFFFVSMVWLRRGSLYTHTGAEIKEKAKRLSSYRRAGEKDGIFFCRIRRACAVEPFPPKGDPFSWDLSPPGFLVRDAFFFPALLRIGCVKKKQFVSFSYFSHHYSNFKKAHPKNFSAEIFLARKTGCQIYFCVCASACPWYTK